MDWQAFRPLLKKSHQKKRKSHAGRKPWYLVRMFKMLVLRSLYYLLSDDQAEYQVRDRLSFQRFLGLAPEERVPDAKTLWLFREQLARHGLVEKLFDAFDQQLWEAGFIPRGGQITDARLVNVPRNRNRRKENEQIKAGEVLEGWDEQPNMKRQKDLNARWTKKHSKSHYVHKNHINIDSKLIRRYQMTDAAVHDSQVFYELLDEQNSGRSSGQMLPTDRRSGNRSPTVPARRSEPKWNMSLVIFRYPEVVGDTFGPRGSSKPRSRSACST